MTLVIEDSAGKRVRNLVSETPFPAGANTAWWDGMDDLLRDKEAARHGIYRIPAQFVAPGTYRVRGLVHKPHSLHYEFSGYNAGSPPWPTPDHTGGWTTNHTPPQSALFVPGEKPLVYLGSYIAEGGDGLAWVDLDGRKQGGKGWVGGTWTGAPYLAYDAGTTTVIVGSAWEGELRLTAVAPGGQEKPILKQKFEGGKHSVELTGLAARNGVMVASLPRQKQLIFVDVKAGKIQNGADRRPARSGVRRRRPAARLSGKRLLRFAGEPKTLVDGLEDPQHVALDPEGNLYVSDRGTSHQVKVFSADGKPPHDRRRRSPEGRTVRPQSHEQPERHRDRLPESALGDGDRFPAQARQRLVARRESCSGRSTAPRSTAAAARSIRRTRRGSTTTAWSSGWTGRRGRRRWSA